MGKNHAEAKALAERVLTDRLFCGDEHHRVLAAGVLALLAEIERLQGLQPVPPLRPPEGEGLPRYGLRWNGPSSPLTVPMEDGYWTPWHLADQLKAENEALRDGANFRAVQSLRADCESLRKDAERYRFLSPRFLSACQDPGDGNGPVLGLLFKIKDAQRLGVKFGVNEAIDAAMGEEAGNAKY